MITDKVDAFCGGDIDQLHKLKGTEERRCYKY